MRASPLHQQNNRTGLARAYDRAEAMVDGAARAEPSSTDRKGFVATHKAYIEDAEAVGTMPPPAADIEAAPAVLLDRLGERLAFERTGVRLYDGLLLKLGATGSFRDGPSERDLKRIRTEEHEHFETLEAAIRELGGDPTAITPSANLAGIESAGISSVIADPRADLADGLHALLVAELADNAGWEQLIELCEAAGYEALAETFEQCRTEEAEHLASVRQWLAAHAMADLRE
jgi:rubrerythrin